MTVGITNTRSSIAREFAKLVGPDEEIINDPVQPFCDRWLICDGYLAGKEMLGMTRDDAAATWHRNFADVVAMCDLILDHNQAARIVVISSESAFRGSFDMAYAGAKAALNLYIETTKLRTKGQQLVGIAPTIIWDSGMTQRRKDLDAVAKVGAARRMGRWLSAGEVAALAHFLLFVDQGAITNTVIRMNGGNW